MTSNDPIEDRTTRNGLSCLPGVPRVRSVRSSGVICSYAVDVSVVGPCLASTAEQPRCIGSLVAARFPWRQGVLRWKKVVERWKESTRGGGGQEDLRFPRWSGCPSEVKELQQAY